MSYLSRKDCKGTHAKESEAYCRAFPMKLVKKELKIITGPLSQKRPKITEFGHSCTHLSQGSMRILWPFHQNTSYTLEAEMLFLDNFCFNDIFTVSKRLRRPEKDYFYPLRDARSSAVATPSSTAWV